MHPPHMSAMGREQTLEELAVVCNLQVEDLVNDHVILKCIRLAQQLSREGNAAVS